MIGHLLFWRRQILGWQVCLVRKVVRIPTALCLPNFEFCILNIFHGLGRVVVQGRGMDGRISEWCNRGAGSTRDCRLTKHEENLVISGVGDIE